MTEPTAETLHLERRADGTAVLTLARPHVHNALNARMITELTEMLGCLGNDPMVRAVVLKGEGKSFSAGADLEWMKHVASFGPNENLADAEALARLMRDLNRLPKPTIARVHGPAFGGGVGLVACCDIAVASETASFCLSEVRLGLIPAVISPYVLAAIGDRAARRWFLTAERFSAVEAEKAGLIHQVTAPEALDDAVEALLVALRAGAPGAQAAAKDLISAVAGRRPTPELIADTAQRIATLRAGPEGREGIAAFLEKRPPAWKA